MTAIILVILFLLQVISFYLITLLYTKLSKLRDLEKQQQRVLVEIEDSFGAYIAEIKDENNRLIQELKNPGEMSMSKETKQIENKEQEKQMFEFPKAFVSKQIAASSYSKIANTSVPVTIKEKVLYHDDEGKSIEEIAKYLQIGKTEVELYLKFKH